MLTVAPSGTLTPIRVPTTEYTFQLKTPGSMALTSPMPINRPCLRASACSRRSFW